MLIGKVKGSNAGNIGSEANEIDQALKSEFDLSLVEIIEKSNEDLLNIVGNMNEVHIENIIELLFEINKKSKEQIGNLNLNTSELIKKNILLIEFLDKRSNTFSMPRMNMKNTLQQWL